MLALHNVTRWIVLLTGAWAVIRAWRGYFQGGSWTSADTTATRAFVIALDVQLLVGLLLYFVFSPLTRQAMSDIGAAMRDPSVRYFAVDHVTIMLLAIVAAHVGSARARRATSDQAKFRMAAVWLGISLAAIAGFVPWFRPMI